MRGNSQEMSSELECRRAGVLKKEQGQIALLEKPAPYLTKLSNACIAWGEGC